MKQIAFMIFALIALLCLAAPGLAAPAGATLTVDGILAGVYPTPQAAVDRVTQLSGADFLIEIAGGTVSDPLSIGQQPGKSLTLRPQPGAAVTFTNTITIDGNGNFNSPESLTIQGFTFDMRGGGAANCIDLNRIPPRTGYCYAHNIVIEDCRFQGIEGVTVAVQSVAGGMNNISIARCSASAMHSLAQLKAVSGKALIQSCQLTDSSEGINFYGTANLVVSSSQIRVSGYALRSGQGSGAASSAGSVMVTNSVLQTSSNQDGAVVLRGDSPKAITISQSDITNTSPAGPAIQNLNLASAGQYALSLVNSNIAGDIVDIAPASITVIDDPGVPSGPVAPPSSTLLVALIVLAALCFALALALAYVLR